MIVKNESKVIEACLASVKPLIDYWVIIDTGSDDNTKEIIKNFMKEIPGELYERPWVNFAYNRNEALALAKNKGDYVLLIDADEVLQCSKDFSLPVLEKDIYPIVVREIGIADTWRNGLIRNDLDWKWKGVLHEVLYCPEVKHAEILKGALILCNTHIEGSSGRSRESLVVKYRQDIEVLEKALEDDPDNSRYVHYLGVSYAGAGEYELARKSFAKRVALPSNDFYETYLAIYSLGRVQEVLGDLDGALASFARAYTWHPVRAEPLVCSARVCRQKGDLILGYLLARQALTLNTPEDALCIEYLIYDYVRLIEFVNCALLVNKFEEAFYGCSELLANPNLPSEYRSQVMTTFKQLESLQIFKF